jgi:WD40 repeat protein/transcriptional regulator with XRE-family HTH domain
MDQAHASSPTNSFSTFGDLLKYLRRRARLTQLELSIAVGYSEGQISRLEQNQRLPDVAALKALFVPALYLEDEPELVARLLDLAQSARQEDGPAPGLSPYKGLLFFDENDAGLFFGREALTARLVERVMELSLNATTRFLAVVGASGSGKSSLVRAGLAVALQQAGWQVRVFTPSASPLRMLDHHLPADRTEDAEQTLILVDQFEELFTLCHSELERIGFIERLLAAAGETSKWTSVVIALRADFYSFCAQYPFLREAVAGEQVYIGQMTLEELRCAIEEPARRGGWELEPGLIEVLLADISMHGSMELEPGALPLLSHALLATWQLRRGRTMTLNGYRASGGIRRAIAETAEGVFTDQLNRAQQDLAQDVFLRLTELGEGTEDTRRRAALNELVRCTAEAAQVRAVLNTLAEARLVTLNEDSAEVAHEALIREWDRLHQWLTQDRESLLLHRHITAATHEWGSRSHDPAELYRGARLAQAREWAAVNGERLSGPEQAFLAASIEQEEHDALEREAQRQRELEASQKLAQTEHAHALEETQSANRLRARNCVITSVGFIAIILALVAGMFGVQSDQNAIAAQNNAATAQVAKDLSFNAQGTAQAANTQAIADFTISEAQRLALEANDLILNKDDPTSAALLAIRSLNLHYTSTGDAVLTSISTLPTPPRVLTGHEGDASDIAISPDGKFVVAGGVDKTAILWDFASGKTVQVLSGHTDSVTAVDYSPDGKYIATGSDDYTVRLWDVATGKTMRIFTGQRDHIQFLTFSPDGKYILTTGPWEARVWDVSSGKAALIISSNHHILFFRARYSPDGKYFAIAIQDNTVRLYDAATGEQVHVFAHPGTVQAVAFSPDGRSIATAGSDRLVQLWDVKTEQVIREYTGHLADVKDVRFSPDGRTLITASLDNTSRMFDIATGKTLRIFHSAAAVQSALFTPDGKYVLNTNRDNVDIWSLKTAPGGMIFSANDRPIRKASFSPDGKLIVTASDDHTARIWNVASGQMLLVLSGHTAAVTDAVFSPDGKMILTASADKSARLWDASTGQELSRFEGHTDEVEKVLFSPDGKYVVTASNDGSERVWETQTGKLITTYTNQNSVELIPAVFSPDGKMVATAGQDRTVRLWDPMTGKDLRVLKGHNDIIAGIAFSPDGKLLFTSSGDGTNRVWDIARGKEIHIFPGYGSTVYSAAFSPDNKYVLTSGAAPTERLWDQTARLWDVQTGQELRRFAGHTDKVRFATFSPDGKYILTASQDGTARLWLTSLDETIQAVCAMLTRDLTYDERIRFNLSAEPTCPAQ